MRSLSHAKAGLNQTTGFPFLLAASLILFLVHALMLANFSEDAFISLRFAKNLGLGHGLTWNVGEAPVEGYTNFLWTVLCAVPFALGRDGVLFAQVLGWLAGAACVVLVYRWCRVVFELPRRSAGLGALLTASAGPLAYWATSGMETPLFALMILGGWYAFARYWQVRESRWLWAGCTCFFLATLTRPEGLMVGLIAAGLSALGDEGSMIARLRRFGPPAATCAAMFALYMAWRIQRYGYLLPNTYYAKTGGGYYQYLRGLISTAYFGLHFLIGLVPCVLVQAWEGAEDKRSPQARRRSRTALALLVTCTAYTVYIVYVGGDYMAMHRFFVPLLPFIYVLFTVSMDRVLAGVHARPHRRWVAGALIGVAFAATVVHSTPLDKSVLPRPRLQNGNYDGFVLERWHTRRLTLLGRFFDGHKRSESDSLATGAIGAIGYYANLRVLDYRGLVDPHIAHEPAPREMGLRRAGHERSDIPYVFSMRPTYFMLNRDLTPEPTDLFPTCPPEIRSVIEENYENKSVWLDDRANGESGFFTFLEKKGPPPDAVGRVR